MAVKIGLSASDLQSDKLFYTIPSNTTITGQIVVGIDQIISGHFCHLKKGDSELVWAYSGDGDPSDKMDNVYPKFSVVVPAIIKEGTEKNLRYIRGPKQFQNQLIAINSRLGNIENLIVKFERKDGDSFAKYSITPTGKRAKPSGYNSEEVLKELMGEFFQGTPEEILEWLDGQIELPSLIDFETEEL